MNTRNDVEREVRYTLRAYDNVRIPLTLVRGEGRSVYDAGGKRYLDLYGGHAVSLLGHGHPQWVEAVTRQAREMAFYSNVCYHPQRSDAAELLVRHSYPSMEAVFFCNSGTEANEAALKLARKAAGRRLVVSMQGGFHGRTAGSLGVTGFEGMRAAGRPNTEDATRFVPLGEMAALEVLDPGEVAAVMLEPIQSVGGVRVAPPEYYRALRAYCDRHGIVLVFDEVQTGSGRTGKWFVGEHWGVEPDIVSTAKGVGGGFPVGVVIASRAITDTVEPGDLGSTFGGGPMAAAAVAATYRIVRDENLVERVAATSEEVIARLRGFEDKGVREVRGLGYLLGIECDRAAKEVQKRLLEEGVIVGSSSEPRTIRLLPPLNTTDEEWHEFFDAFARVLKT